MSVKYFLYITGRVLNINKAIFVESSYVNLTELAIQLALRKANKMNWAEMIFSTSYFTYDA